MISNRLLSLKSFKAFMARSVESLGEAVPNMAFTDRVSPYIRLMDNTALRLSESAGMLMENSAKCRLGTSI